MLFLCASGAVLADSGDGPGEVGNAGRSIAPLNSRDGSPTPVLFPSSPAGWPGEIRDARDTAPYLAFHKAAMARRAESLEGEALLRDPSPNQLLFDARYYNLDLSLNPTTRILTGTVTGRFTVLGGPLGQVELNLSNGMTVSSVTSGGQPATYTHASQILRVNLDRPYATGESVTIVVSYSGNPSGDAWGWDSHGGAPMIWTLSEPYGGRTWWPSKDWSDDKADSVDIRVTAPTGLIAASNGTLRQQTDNGVVSYSWWHEDYPISTYLVSLAVHAYHVYSDWYRPTPSDSMEIKFFNYPSSIPDVEPVQALVKDMIAVFAEDFGAYPFLDEKYGHAEFPWGGGMEHQTCTSLGYFGESVVAHELAHQWWGDMVTCEDFHHVWLNEGFATYAEALWAESVAGTEGYRQEMAASMYFGPGTIYVPDLNDWGRIFDSNLSYNKASWIPHMIRGMVGDATFFQVVDAYYDQYRYSVATTQDFQAVVESVTGRDLDAFFQQWIYGEYYPIYEYGWSAQQAGGGWDVHLNVQQLQTWQLFQMPVWIEVETAAGTRSFQIQNSEASQDYVLHVDAQPSDLQFDPDNWILRVVLAPLPVPSFDRETLLVNAVDWDAYGGELVSSYADRAYWGTHTIDFWDTFNPPAGGYPTTLPAPLGHGTIPGEVLAHYRNVIWVGGAYGGDQACWNDSPFYSYLNAGGNVILLTRMANDYLIDPFRQYLGITWTGSGNVYDCISNHPNLTNIARVGTQSYVAGFNLTVGPESTVLYKAVQGHTPNWGLGVLRQPAAGGTYNPYGGRFLLLNGRPYRWNHADLRTNIEYVLDHWMLNPAGISTDAAVPVLSLRSPLPNPFGETTALRFVLPSAGPARLAIWDIGGRRVRELLNETLSAGEHSVSWDGLDQGGRPVASGVYYLRLEASGASRETSLLRIR